MSFTVIESATAICLRQAPSGSVPAAANRTISRQDISKFVLDRDSKFIRDMFRKEGNEITFQSNWEVLMGQAEVVNWLKSTSDKLVRMRYGGEYRFAGGAYDTQDGALERTAIRELEEEFMLEVPESARFRFFNIKQTKPIRGRSYVMNNFVALADENLWLANLDVSALNTKLARRRALFQRLKGTAEWEQMSIKDKMQIAPEVREVAWLPIRDAVFIAMTSKAAKFIPVNPFQQREFANLGIRHRDPMFQTLSILLDLERTPTIPLLLQHCKRMEAEDADEIRSKVTRRFMRHRNAFAREDANRIKSEMKRRKFVKRHRQSAGDNTDLSAKL